MLNKWYNVLGKINDNIEIVNNSLSDYIYDQMINDVYDVVYCENAEDKYDFANDFEVKQDYVNKVENMLSDFFQKHYDEVISEMEGFLEYDLSSVINVDDCSFDIDVYDIVESDREDSLSYIFKEEKEEEDNDVDMIFERYYGKE